MRRPREAVNATVLTATIGIDRAIEPYIGRLVAGDDLAGAVEGNCRFEFRQFIEALPAVIESLARLGFKPAGGIRLSASPSPALVADMGRNVFVPRVKLGVGKGRRETRLGLCWCW